MQPSPSTSNAATNSQENAHISRNPNVHYHVHKSPPLVRPMVSHRSPVYIILPYTFKIHFNNILPPMRRYCKWSPSFSPIRAKCETQLNFLDFI
jgi:hypothetical protein